MPSVISTIFFALHAVSFIPVLASPIPLPRAITRYSRTSTDYLPRLQYARTTMSNPEPSLNFRSEAPSDHEDSDHISKIRGHYRRASDTSEKMKKLAAKSASVGPKDYNDFQQESVSQLKTFNSQISGLNGLLAELGADKGLAFYDKTNDVEKLLKGTIDFNKDTLNSVYTIVHNIPGLGPVLGPIVYNIKCLLDELLDICENVLDAVINGLGPVLQPLIGSASTFACASGVKVLGLCI